MRLVRRKKGFYLPVAAFAGSGAGASFNTLNPSDKDSSITLSGGNLTATASASSWNSVRAVKSTSSGKVYWEETLNGSPAGDAMLDGFANATENLTATIAGNDNNALTVDYASGQVRLNGVQTTYFNAASGDTIGFAVDFTNKLFWVKRVGVSPTNWNNDVSADPATGTNGFSFSTMAAGPYFAIVCLFGSISITANFGATAYVGTPPSGFGNW